MQNKGAIRLFAILLALVCLYQLAFTIVARRIESDAKDYATVNGKIDQAKESRYLDSLSGQIVYNFLGLQKLTFKEVKEREINLGLDLKGGMNVTLQVSVVDLIRSLSNFNKDATFNAAIDRAIEKQKNSQEDFVSLFGKSITEIDPNAKLAAYFSTTELKDRVNFNSTNSDVLEVLEQETDVAIENSFNILRTRIDRFGVAQPNIQKLQQRGRILVELPGVKDRERVRKLLQGTASLEFWETYENQEVTPFLMQANQIIKDIEVTTAPAATTTPSSAASLLDGEIKKDSSSIKKDENKEFPLFNVLIPNLSREGQPQPGPAVGLAHIKDTSKVNYYLNLQQIKAIQPKNLILRWAQKPLDEAGNMYYLIALKVTTHDGRAPLDGGVITNASQDFGQSSADPEVNMSMNAEGARIWARITKENLGKSVAIVLDDYVVSYPTVQSEITGGRSNITGKFSIDEAKDLANMLKSGKMPAPARIEQEEIVGPSLGKEAIASGMWSFVIAFALVLAYMLIFYSRYAGLTANVALLANLFFLVGVLASFGAVLTLPGIAGIVLTMGMAVDANVLIYERIEEEILGGKGVKLAVHDGYRNAYSAIIDGQVTTLLTGIVLYIFGSGPIKGFATTLIIGILTSLFTAIFITRLIFERRLDKNKKILFTTPSTKDWMRNIKYNFIGNRKVYYYISGIVMLIAVVSISIKGFDYGVDFKGGRTYVVRFDGNVKVADVANSLSKELGSAPEVKTFGESNQVRITTDYKIDDQSETVDSELESKLFAGLTSALGSNVTKEDFVANHIMSSSKVGPTISDDIQKDAILAVIFALVIIFLYIVARFRNWQYGIGALLSLLHDAFFVLGLFSIASSWFPFALEIDQAFIAAILTVLGYSINDTVIIFDRVREYNHLYPKRDSITNINNALNSTLRRTFNTTLTTLVVLVAIFIFGGATIRGFCFALLVGIAVGTYSSLFVATPIAYDSIKKWGKREADPVSKK